MQTDSLSARRVPRAFVLFLASAAALALPALLPGAAHAGNPESQNAVPAVVDVGCQGRVLPAGRIRRVATPADQGVPIIQRLLVDEGAEVKAGDVLAVLAAEKPARLMRDQAIAKVAAATAALAAAEAEATLALAEIAPRRDDARAARAEAESALTAVKTAAARKQVPDGTVRELEAALAAAHSAHEQLRAGKAVFTARADAAVQTAIAQRKEAGNWGAGRIAEAALAEARAAREDALREYAAREAAAAAEAALAKARLEAARARNALPERTAAEVASATQALEVANARSAALDALTDATRAANASRISSARAEVEIAKAAVLLAGERLAQTNVRSPVSGRILRVFAREGEGPGAGGVVAEVADLSLMSVEAEVAVPDIPRVKVGAAVEISVSGWAGPAFRGTVSRIGLRVSAGALADENPASLKDLRVIPVEIALDAASSRALSSFSGTQVSVKIKAAPRG